MEKPNWERGDGLRSIKDFGSLILDTIADLIPMDVTIEKIDDDIPTVL